MNHLIFKLNRRVEFVERNAKLPRFSKSKVNFPWTTLDMLTIMLKFINSVMSKYEHDYVKSCKRFFWPMLKFINEKMIMLKVVNDHAKWC